MQYVLGNVSYGRNAIYYMEEMLSSEYASQPGKG